MTSLRGMVQTVLGPIRPDEARPDANARASIVRCHAARLGRGRRRGNAHHIAERLGDQLSLGNADLGVSRILNRDIAVRELKRMRDHGGRAVVELTNHGLKRDPAGLQAIARRAQVHVIMGSGTTSSPFSTPRCATAAAGRSPTKS